MQVFGPSGTRNHPTDRAAARGGVTVAIQGMPAAADTIFATYTVPANRRSLLSVDWYATIFTALAAGQVADLIIQTRPAAAGAITIIAQRRFQAAAAIGVDKFATFHGLWMLAGNVLELRGSIGAGAGVAQVAGGVHALEYDA